MVNGGKYHLRGQLTCATNSGALHHPARAATAPVARDRGSSSVNYHHYVVLYVVLRLMEPPCR